MYKGMRTVGPVLKAKSVQKFDKGEVFALMSRVFALQGIMERRAGEKESAGMNVVELYRIVVGVVVG
jgi:hypothetical protein